jgi:hypothetical protein
MAFKMDLSSLEEPIANGSADGDLKARSKEPTFDPMRRKLYIKE